jgi:hypothetical protein
MPASDAFPYTRPGREGLGGDYGDDGTDAGPCRGRMQVWKRVPRERAGLRGGCLRPRHVLGGADGGGYTRYARVRVCVTLQKDGGEAVEGGRQAGGWRPDDGRLDGLLN